MIVVPHWIESKGRMSMVSLRPRFPTLHMSAFRISESDECLIVKDSSKHVQRLVDRTYYCPGAELNCEELSHYVSWLEDLDTVKTNFLPGLRNISTENVRPIVFVMNYGHIYLGRMVRFLLFVLSASFPYIIFKAKLHC